MCTCLFCNVDVNSFFPSVTKTLLLKSFFTLLYFIILVLRGNGPVVYYSLDHKKCRKGERSSPISKGLLGPL